MQFSGDTEILEKFLLTLDFYPVSERVSERYYWTYDVREYRNYSGLYILKRSLRSVFILWMRKRKIREFPRVGLL